MLLGTESLKEKLESEGLHWQLVLVGWRDRSTRPGWDRFSRSQELACAWWQAAWMTDPASTSWVLASHRADCIRGLEQGRSSQALLLSSSWVTVYPPVPG